MSHSAMVWLYIINPHDTKNNLTSDNSLIIIVDILGVYHTKVSRIHSEWYEKQKTPSERQIWECKLLVGAGGQRKIARPIQANRKATITQIATLYNHDQQNQQNRRLQWAQDQQNWIVKDCHGFTGLRQYKDTVCATKTKPSIAQV